MGAANMHHASLPPRDGSLGAGTPPMAGQGLANPIGAVGSAALMLDHLGLPGPAARLHAAIEATTAAGILTRDLGGTASTEDVTKALIDTLRG